MADLTIKNIPDDLYEALQAAANAHEHSVDEEVVRILGRSLQVINRKPRSDMEAQQVLERAAKLRDRAARSGFFLTNDMANQIIDDRDATDGE